MPLSGAVRVKIQVSKGGIPAIMERLNLGVRAVKAQLKKEIPAYLNAVQKEAKNIIAEEAFDTGALYSSIKVTIAKGGLWGYVASIGIPYSEFVSQGHWLQPWGNPKAARIWIPGVYFMERAIMRNKNRTPLISASIIKAWRDYGKGGEHLYSPEMQQQYYFKEYAGGRLSLTKLSKARKAQKASRSSRSTVIKKRVTRASRRSKRIKRRMK